MRRITASRSPRRLTCNRRDRSPKFRRELKESLSEVKGDGDGVRTRTRLVAGATFLRFQPVPFENGFELLRVESLA
jgi:hypothetical protein